MHMTTSKAQKMGLIGKIKVFINGKEVGRVLEFMTGKRGFIVYCEKEMRVFGNEFERKYISGNVTCVINN